MSVEVSTTTPRPIAFYLPQFHPIPENDAWWGTGFTEWNNVVRGRPLFPGHYQPHLPTELGFYDLRVPEVRAAQAELADEHGIHGFCYYHYWFSGTRLLERTFDEVLKSGEPSLPFMLCWVNSDWRRTWHETEGEVLIRQTHSASDDIEHARVLAEAFADPRYIRVNGRPVFLVFLAGTLPDPLGTTDRWRSEVTRLGLPEPLLCVVGYGDDRYVDPSRLGFDAAVDFQPDWARLGPPITPRRRWRSVRRESTDLRDRPIGLFDYRAVVDLAVSAPRGDWLTFPGTAPMWDNTARRGSRGTVLDGSTPELYGRWLQSAIDRVPSKEPGGADLLFINAWNEWGEGTHLEPCDKWGRAYLIATRDTLARNWAVPPTTGATHDG